jgi:glutathione S-transferase
VTPRALDIATSVAATLLRGGVGARVGNVGARPSVSLELYVFEGCPFCRKVREALSMLDLDARIFPCPKGGPTYRPAIVARGGLEQFPFLVDPYTCVEMYESERIVAYWYASYGQGGRPLLATTPLNVGVFLVGIVRLGGGTFYEPSQRPVRPLELYSYEASPFCRIVRERLSTRELPYMLHNVARGSTKREGFKVRAGRVMVPYLIDPNSGVQMFESADIVRYLDREYGPE